MTALVAAAACGGSQAPPSESAAPSSPAATPAGQTVDESKAGDVTGKVVLDGAPPPNEAIKMNSDPVCLKQATGTQTQEFFVVGEGGALQNVFVYVKDGLGDYVFETPTEALKFDQSGCRYRPHVFGVRVGQPIEIMNSDPTLHNIHALPKENQEFNTGQPIQGMKFTHTFTTPEVMVPFKCDVHGWMNAHVGVLAHPYFAVTSADGTFSLNKLPAGTYTVEAWHEKLGTQTQSVTVGPNETKEVSFTFKSTT
jgi:plastocyanin